MTRFMRELNGDFGAFWKAEAEKELACIKADLETGKITIDESGVARNCIGRPLMDDMLEKLSLVTDKATRAPQRPHAPPKTRSSLKSTVKTKKPPAPKKSPRCAPLLATAQQL